MFFTVMRDFFIVAASVLSICAAVICLFGRQLEIGAIEYWICNPTARLTLVCFAGFAGAVGALFQMLLSKSFKLSASTVCSLFVCSQFIAIPCLIFSEYALGRAYVCTESLDKFRVKRPLLFTCNDGEITYGCSSDEAVDQLYVHLTNELIQLTFLQRCIDDSAVLLIFPLIIGFIVSFKLKANKVGSRA